MKLSFAVEQLLPLEAASLLNYETTTYGVTVAIAVFGWRLIVDVIIGRHKHGHQHHDPG